MITNAATGAYSYGPASNYNGSDSFTFKACDDATPSLCSTAVISIIVNPVNDVPTANAQSVSTNEDMAVAITLTGNDGDPEVSQTLTYALVSGPSHGSLPVF